MKSYADGKMGKPSGILSESFASTASISEDVPESHVNDVQHFLKGVGISDPVPDHCDTKDFYSYLIRGILKPLNIQRGRVTCLVSVKPAFTVKFSILLLSAYVQFVTFHSFMFVLPVKIEGEE